MTVVAVSGLAERLHHALVLLTAERQPHACGGFTTDDMQWRLGVGFLPEADLAAAVEELGDAGLIRWVGADESCAVEDCYELKPG